MGEYILRRVLQAVPLLFLISVLVYALLLNMPGDPLFTMLEGVEGEYAVNPEDYARLRRLYGLDDPFYIQYFKWIGQFIQGNMGFSRYYGQPVEELVLSRAANTFILAFSAMFIGKTVAIILGIYSARNQYSPGDYMFTAFTFFGYSVPGFWLALLLIILFSVTLGWLPTGGFVSPNIESGTFAYWQSRFLHIILPLFTLALSETIQTQRFMRASLLEVLRMDYLITARAKGLSERVVIYRHAMKNALIPVVTVIAYSIPRVIGGSVVIETVFSYPGMGRLLFTSIDENDFTTAMAIVMLIGVLVIGFNLIADILYGYLDPRVRYASRET